MKIQNDKDLKLFWKGGTAFLFFMAIALVTFFYFVEKDVNKNVEKTLRDNLERQNHHLQTILDLQFQKRCQTFRDFTAQIIQHEMDHFEGILI